MTYRTGAATAMTGAKLMADHLLTQTLPREAADLALYYDRGQDSLGSGVADQQIRGYAEAVARGAIDMEWAIEALGPAKVKEPVTRPALPSGNTPEDRMIPTFAWMVANGMMEPGEALDAILESDRLRSADPQEWDWRPAEARIGRKFDAAVLLASKAETSAVLDAYTRLRREMDSAVTWERIKNDRSATTAEPRRDMHPEVASRLGIDPNRPLTRQELANLLSGRRTDGEEIEGRRQPRGSANKARIAFVDFTFSADKSVSLAWAMAPTEAERAQFLQAHRDATDAALAHVAGRVGQARIGDGGRGGTELGHVAWVKFDHATARQTVALPVTQEDGTVATEMIVVRVPGQNAVAGDPDLHTHGITPNFVYCDSGRIGSLDLNRLRGFIHEGGAYYQAHLAQNLRRLGVEVTLDQDTGAARVVAVPEDARDHFSKRTKDAESNARSYAKAQGLDWDGLNDDHKAALLKTGARETREKGQGDDLADFASWRAQADAIGWKHEGAVGKVALAPDLTPEQRLNVAYEAALPFLEEQLGRRAVLEIGDVRVAATRGLIASGLDGAVDIDRVMDAFEARGVRQDGQAVSLIRGTERGFEKFTTSLHETLENRVVELVRGAAADTSRALDRAAIDRASAASGLDFTDDHGQAQRRAMDRLAMGGALGVAIGAAGAGKTAMLQPLVAAHRERGDMVYGVALAWRQADDLASAGISDRDRFAVSVFLKQVEDGKVKLDQKSVILVDELFLVGTREFTKLLELRERTGARIYGVGDHLQGQSIEAGALDPLLKRALGNDISVVGSTTRQQGETLQETHRLRRIAGLFADGEAERAIHMKRVDGTAELVQGGYDHAVKRTAQLYMERTAALGSDNAVSITAPTNADTRAIGTEVRRLRREHGMLRGDAVVLDAADQTGEQYRLPLAAGDKVRLYSVTFARGDDGRKFPIGRNGTVADVQDFTKDGLRLRDARGREGMVAWEKLQSRDTGRIMLSYGYALTISAAQGLTRPENINSMPNGTSGVNGFQAYVAESRHRRRSWMVVSEGAERKEISNHRPLGDMRPVTVGDVWANVAQNLSRQPVKESALDFLDAARGLRRSASMGLQAGLRPAQARAALGQEGTILHRTLAAARNTRIVRGVADRLEMMTKSHRAVMRGMSEIGDRVRAATAHGMRSNSAVSRGRSRGISP